MKTITPSGQRERAEYSEQHKWFEERIQCEECGEHLYRAGEYAPAGTYLRVDDGSFHSLSLSAAGVLPASFDGHVALYQVAASPCACQRRHGV